jgi:hypothetical protein
VTFAQEISPVTEYRGRGQKTYNQTEWEAGSAVKRDRLGNVQGQHPGRQFMQGA